jgi:hypothetical protein
LATGSKIVVNNRNFRLCTHAHNAVMKRLLSGFALAFAALGSHGQAPSYGCGSAESRQLDFWIGTWELSFVDDAKPGKSSNKVTKLLDGCVILEEFTGGPGSKLDGRSFSTFDRASGRWKQTWVDNTGAYLDFTGGMVDGKMILAREAPGKDGGRFHQRMVFQDIRGDSLKWLWQRSDDAGKTWTTQWEIDYKRVR